MSFLIKNGKILTIDGKAINVEGGSSSSGATITGEGEWTGTAVQNTGYVEKVYFNTNLSVEEVVSLLSQLILNSEGALECFLMSASGTIAIQCMNMDGAWGIFDAINGEYYFFSEDVGMGFVGWNSNVTYPIVINDEVVNDGGDGIPIGSQNNLISNLFSTTPFTKTAGEPITLEGEYDGSTIEVTENTTLDIKALIENKKIPLNIIINVKNNSSSSGTAVQNTGYVENVYFNTNLSIDEVKNIVGDFEGMLLVTNDMSNMIAVAYENYISDDENNYLQIFTSNGTPLFLEKYSEDYGFEGWNPNIIYPIAINSEVISSFSPDEDVNIPVGTQNELLSSLFSITPFN